MFEQKNSFKNFVYCFDLIVPNISGKKMINATAFYLDYLLKIAWNLHKTSRTCNPWGMEYVEVLQSN